jgi:hypothetical protein
MYLRGITNSAAIGRALGISQQAGSALVHKIRQRLGEQALHNEDFTADKQIAITRAEDVLACAWRDYSNAATIKERNASLALILSTLKYLSDVQGVTAGAKIEVTNYFTQQNTYRLTDEHEQILRETGLTAEDFTDERYEATFEKLVRYYSTEIR